MPERVLDRAPCACRRPDVSVQKISACRMWDWSEWREWREWKRVGDRRSALGAGGAPLRVSREHGREHLRASADVAAGREPVMFND